MNLEVMDLEQLASYLQRDLREVSRLASRGYLPGRKVGGEWRFSRAEINHWVETQMHAYTEQELAVLEGKPSDDNPEHLVGSLLLPECVSVPLQARTKRAVLEELVATAEKSWHVYDPEAILEALREREDMGTTALANGVAIPHPHRPLPNAIGEPVIAFGRTLSPVPFGAERGGLTDVYFLVLCRTDRGHLRALARLSRLLLRPGLLDELRAVESPEETYELLLATERELVGR
jgi:PTS system nitrogen regulatory IIA component